MERERKKVRKIEVYFDDEEVPMVISDVQYTENDEEEEDIERAGHYRYTALFWDDRSITPLLSKYYPTRGVKLTTQMVGQAMRPGRVTADIPFDVLRRTPNDKICDASSIYPADVMHFWKDGMLTDDGFIQPDVILKSSESPITAPKTTTLGNFNFQLMPASQGDFKALIHTVPGETE